VGAGDVTSAAVLPADARASATLVAKGERHCAGLDVARRVFAAVDPAIAWEAIARDGDRGCARAGRGAARRADTRDSHG